MDYEKNRSDEQMAMAAYAGAGNRVRMQPQNPVQAIDEQLVVDRRNLGSLDENLLHLKHDTGLPAVIQARTEFADSTFGFEVPKALVVQQLEDHRKNVVARITRAEAALTKCWAIATAAQHIPGAKKRRK